MGAGFRRLSQLLSMLSICSVLPAAAGAQIPPYITQWGTVGSGNGQFWFPILSAVGPNGNIYVADSANFRIQVFSPSGTYLTKWSANAAGFEGLPYSRYVTGVAVDASGNVFVSASHLLYSEIQKFTSTGSLLTSWGGATGSENGRFDNPRGLALDASGNLYVADSGNSRIQKFTSSGTYITQWGSSGTGNGQLIHPFDVAVDAGGDIYVSESGGDRIQKFTSSGTYLSQWGTPGSRNGELNGAMGLEVDASGHVYVADYYNHRIQVFTSNGGYIAQWGTLGSGNGQFSSLTGVTIDRGGNIYTTEQQNHRIQKFGPLFPPPPQVPALNEWGLATVIMMVTGLGTVLIARRKSEGDSR